jgi:hypothetical protein
MIERLLEPLGLKFRRRAGPGYIVSPIGGGHPTAALDRQTPLEWKVATRRGSVLAGFLLVEMPKVDSLRTQGSDGSAGRNAQKEQGKERTGHGMIVQGLAALYRLLVRLSHVLLPIFDPCSLTHT